MAACSAPVASADHSPSFVVAAIPTLRPSAPAVAQCGDSPVSQRERDGDGRALRGRGGVAAERDVRGGRGDVAPMMPPVTEQVCPPPSPIA
jgi:hypothetical protein